MSWEQKKFLWKHAIKIWRYAKSGCCGISLEANVGNHRMDDELNASSSVPNEDDIIASSGTDFYKEDVEDVHPRNKGESLHRCEISVGNLICKVPTESHEILQILEKNFQK